MLAPDLTYLFNPRSIAIVGASDRPGGLGGRVVENLTKHSDFPGELYLVNPGRTSLFGRDCHPSVSALPTRVDLAMVVVPAADVLDVLDECARHGASFAMVLTSGFGEAGEEGERQQREISRIAAESGMRVVGPNCPGFTNVRDRIGMTFSPAFHRDRLSGPIGLATQGGGLGRNILQAGVRGAGTALWASMGNAADLDVPDIIGWFATDDRVSVIATLLEGIPDGAAFLEAVLAAADAGKPVVALKIGRSEYGVRAVASHTAAMAGEAKVNSAVFAQTGVIEVDDIDELVDVSWLLSRARPPARTRLAVWGLSGGAVSLCADAIGQAGLELTTLADETTQRLAAVLPSYAAVGNPVDVTAAGLSDPDLAYDSLRVLADDPGVDLIIIPIPLDYGDASIPSTEAVAHVQAEVATPLLPVWMSDSHGAGFDILTHAGFAAPSSITKAVTAVSRWAWYGAWRTTQDTGPAPLILRKRVPTREIDLRTRTEPAAKSWLTEHGITVPCGRTVTSEREAATARAELSGPLVAKVVSAEITHKSDVGGVRIGLTDEAEVLAARTQILDGVRRLLPGVRIDGVLIEEMVTDGAIELIVGVHRDPVFGHVLTVGSGGVLVELLRDAQLRLLPVDRRAAAAMIDRLRARPLLDGPRGGPALDVPKLVDLLVAVSDLVTEHPSITELDLNPVVLRPVTADGPSVVALDALVVTDNA